MSLAIDINTDALPISLVVGAIAAAVAGIGALAWRQTRPGIVGLPIAIGALFTIRHELGPASAPLLIFLATIVAFVAGEIGARIESPIAVYLPVLGGIAMAATPSPTVPIAGRVAVAVGAVVMGIALADFDRRHASQGLGVLLLVITCCGAAVIQPGTIAGPAVAAAAIWMVLLLVPVPFARVGAGGACAVSIAFWWTLQITALWPKGGDNLVAGALACGFILFEPLSRAVLQHLSGLVNRRRSTRDAVWLVVATAAAAQCALVVFAAAVIARFDRVDIALLAALPFAVVASIVGTEVVPSPRRQSHHRPSE